MLCILSALKAESEPLINYFKLVKDSSFDFPFFINQNIALVGIGVGKKNISNRINAFFKKFKGENIFFINIGIAGGNSKNSHLGECYLINKIIDNNIIKKNFYPDILIKHFFKEKDITTDDKIVSGNNENYNSLVDMESSEVFINCIKLVSIHQISFLKIVSDYYDLNNQHFEKDYIQLLVKNKINDITQYLNNLNLFIKSRFSILTRADMEWLEKISTVLSLTVYQKQVMKYKVMGFRLNTPDKYLPKYDFIIPKSKMHQKLILKKIIDEISI